MNCGGEKRREENSKVTERRGQGDQYRRIKEIVEVMN